MTAPTLTPASPAAPTVTLTIGAATRAVVFDFNRLVAIEAATGRTALQIIGEFATYSPSLPEGQEPTPEQMREAAERFSLTTVGRFVGGCLDLAAGDVGKALPLGQIRDVFSALVPGFVDAVRQLSGTAEPAADPSEAPQTSAA